MGNSENTKTRIGFVLEDSLGHTTHALNLKRTLAGKSGFAVAPTYIDLPFHNTPGAWAKMPLVRSNWSLRASLGALLALRPRQRDLDGVFFHSQVTSLLSAGIMRRLPSVVSLDATPLQYDALGAFYNHVPSGNTRIEGFKKRMNENAFRAARHLITWSQWAKDSLVDDYAVPGEKITVIPPGIDTDRWNFPRTPKVADAPVNLLFVGGDFARKGGDLLLDAFACLPKSVRAHLHIVTRSEDIGVEIPNVSVYNNLTPNSEGLLHLFAEADLFVFPTRGDCLPLAVMEALAAGLPVITTSVGALPEAVTHRETGWVVGQEDVGAMAEAIGILATDNTLRIRLGAAARAAAVERFDAKKNYEKLIQALKGNVHEGKH